MKRFDLDSIQTKAFENIDTYVNNFNACSHIPSDLMAETVSSYTLPWISILIPTYKRRDVLQAALNSVLRQKAPGFEWEILIIDNTPFDQAGTTPALEMVRGCGARNLRYYHNAVNIGSGYSWNRGVELARGKWIVFLHDDDVLCLDALQNIGKLIKSGRKAGENLGYLNARRVDFRGTFGERTSGDFSTYPQELFTRFGTLVCGNTGTGAPTCGTAILKKAYMEAGGINYAFGPSADAVLCYQIMRNYSVVNTNCIIGGYRWNENATLNEDVLLALVKADDLLMRYAYQRNPLSRLWGKLFGSAISWRNIWHKDNTARENGVTVSKERFAKASLYKEPCVLKKAAYLIVYAAYRLYRSLAGMVMSSAGTAVRISF